MDLGIKGKRVLIIGVGSGIGKSIALAFAGEGAVVTAISRDEQNLKKLISEMKGGKSSGHSYLATELLSEGNPRKTAIKLIKDHKRFDIVVHNIGHHLGIREPLAPVKDWQLIWQLNAGIGIEMNEILIPPMIEQGWGRVIHLSSISAIILRGSPQYCTSKAYLNAYITTVGRYLADKGVVMASVMPGAVEFKGGYWDEIKKSNPGKYYGFLKEHQAIGRMGTPEEIASFVVFVGSVHSSFATGTNIPVDGGNM
jgi:3-oxoacyl-[acyl-carrier protein] reductase